MRGRSLQGTFYEQFGVSIVTCCVRVLPRIVLGAAAALLSI